MSKCNHWYDFIEIVKDRDGKDWYSFYCKKCLSMEFFVPDFENPEKVKKK